MKIDKKVAVVGLGYVGLPLAILACKKGYDVVGIDIDKNKIDSINKKKSPFYDKKIDTDLKDINLKATTNLKEIKNQDIIVICVPTPVYENHLPNYEPVISACKTTAQYITKNSLVILESTVNPGTTDEMILPLMEKTSGLKVNKDFYLAYCPERINPGDKKWNVENINRVVGSYNKEGLNRAYNFYTSILNAEIKKMNNVKEAEAVKIVENCFRDINIAFVNELAMSFQKMGIDIVNVIDGAATKPFSFMAHYPGCGVGGHCISVDPYYLIHYAKKFGIDHKILSLARETNNYMPKYAVELLLNAIKNAKLNLKDLTVGVLGLSYKANVGDDRESPSYVIIDTLKSNKLKVVQYDPYLLNKSSQKDLKSILKKSNVLIISSAHDDFKKLTPKDLRDNNINIIVDGRNCLDKNVFLESGITYIGIGR